MFVILIKLLFYLIVMVIILLLLIIRNKVVKVISFFKLNILYYILVKNLRF